MYRFPLEKLFDKGVSRKIPTQYYILEVYMTKYGSKAQESVENAMHKMKEGKLESGKSHQKVTNPKQAIAIGLSEARKKGAKVPKKSG